MSTTNDRDEAIMLIMTAFETAAPQRVNTPAPATMAQGILALRALGADIVEIDRARRLMGWEHMLFPPSACAWVPGCLGAPVAKRRGEHAMILTMVPVCEAHQEGGG